MARARFSTTNKKKHKAARGRTAVHETPIAIRSRVELPPGFRQAIRDRMASKIGHAATLIERGTVRFEDINGPRGGVDTLCRIKLVLSHQPSVQVDAHGKSPRDAFARALSKVASRLRRTVEKHNLSAPAPPPRGTRSAGSSRDRAVDAGEIIGPRVGRGASARASALERPEKERRDAYVDTAEAGVSETDRKAGGDISARRNSRARTSRATVALEDSRTAPSRKSTRRSSNRGKPSQTKERAAVAQSVTPGAVARRAKARRKRTD